MTKAAFGWCLLVGLALVGCKDEKRDTEVTRDVPGPNGVLGVCCPASDFEGCSPGDPLPAGGWAKDAESCVSTIEGYDGAPYVKITDEWGCAAYGEDNDPSQECGRATFCPATAACPEGEEGDGCQYIEEACPGSDEGGYLYVCLDGQWTDGEPGGAGCPDVDGGDDDGGMDGGV